MRLLPLILALASLASCAPEAPPVVEAETETRLPVTSLPIFGDGYPKAGDPCRRVGESAETADFLDHTRALVGCPQDWTGRDAYARSVGAEEVLRQDGWVLYSIPLGI